MLEREKRESLQGLVRGGGGDKNIYKCNTKADSFYSLRKGLIVKLLSVNTSEFYATPLVLRKMGFRPLDLYEKPKRATTLGINIATGLENKAVEYPIKSLHDGNKCLVLPSEND